MTSDLLIALFVDFDSRNRCWAHSTEVQPTDTVLGFAIVVGVGSPHGACCTGA